MKYIVLSLLVVAFASCREESDKSKPIKIPVEAVEVKEVDKANSVKERKAAAEIREISPEGVVKKDFDVESFNSEIRKILGLLNNNETKKYLQKYIVPE